MITKLINIIEANQSLDYESFYDFDIEKIFISHYLPNNIRMDNKTTYLSLFGKKRILDGDWCFHTENIWKKGNLKKLHCSIRRNNEHYFYNQTVKDLIPCMDNCEHIIVTGAMRNTASVFLKIILKIAEQKNIRLTVLYYSPSFYAFYDEINENQIKYFNNLISKYKNINLIHIDLKKYEFLGFLATRFVTDIAKSIIYDLTSIIIGLSKKDQISKAMVYKGNIKYLQDYNNFLIFFYRSISDDYSTSSKRVLKQFFSRTTKVLFIYRLEMIFGIDSFVVKRVKYFL